MYSNSKAPTTRPYIGKPSVLQNQRFFYCLLLSCRMVISDGPLASNIGNPVNVDTIAGGAPGDEETRQQLPPQAPQPPQRPKPTPQPQRNFIPTGGVYDNQPIIPSKGVNPYQNRRNPYPKKFPQHVPRNTGRQPKSWLENFVTITKRVPRTQERALISTAFKARTW